MNFRMEQSTRRGSALSANVGDTCDAHVHFLQRESFSEFFLTATVENDRDPRGARQIFEWASSTLAEKNVRPIQEKIYGVSDRRKEIMEIRDAAFSKSGLGSGTPITYLEGTPIFGSGMAGLQIWGIAPNGSSPVDIRTIALPGEAPARYWKGNGFRMLYLPIVRGTNSDGNLPAGAGAQAERMFANAGNTLKANGFSYRHVARTWIYLARLLDWYDEFNRVRTAHYGAEGLGTGPGGVLYPASTGIQGRHAEEECFMSVLALDSEPTAGVAVDRIQRSRRQECACAYGSAFSRGATIEMGGRKTVHVSGTASIDASGATLYAGDNEAQVLETLMNVSAILQDQGGGLENICSGTLFCKTREAYEAYRNVTRRQSIPFFPVVPMIADICRHDLLMELEAVAII